MAIVHTTTLCAALALNGLATAGDVVIETLVIDGDTAAGVGVITSIDNLAVNDLGQWIVEADTNNPDIDADGVLIRNGALYLREGGPLDMPGGATIDSFDSINLNNMGDSAWNLFLDGTKSSFDDSGIYVNDDLVLQEGDIASPIEFTPGTLYIGFFDVKNVNNSVNFLSVVSVDDPAIPTSVDRALVLFEAPGMGLIQTAIAKEGDVLPDQTESITDFGTGPHETAINDGLEVMFAVEFTGDSATNAAIYTWSAIDGFTNLAQEGSESAIKGRNWTSLTSTELDLSNSGDAVFSGRMDGDAATNLIIVRNGVKFRQEGDAAPTSAAGKFQFTSFGSGPLYVGDNGQVLWYGDWDDPDTDVDTGLFIDNELLVQEGVTTIDGVIVDTLRGVQDGYALSDNGRYVIFEAVLLDGRDGAFMIDLGEGCPWDLNGSGGVDPADLAILLGEWGAPYGPPELAQLLGSWGPCP